MIRTAVASDAPQLLALMRELAQFEGYADRFAVTQRDLLARGLDGIGNEFTAWVAEHQAVLAGYAVAYLVPFTFDLRPTLVLKEMFVVDSARSLGLGDELFAAVVAFGRRKHARLLRWQVLPDNVRAQHFYRRHGGTPDVAWDNWLLDVDRG